MIIKDRSEELKEQTGFLLSREKELKSQIPEVKGSFVCLPFIQFPSEFPLTLLLSSFGNSIFFFKNKSEYLFIMR